MEIKLLGLDSINEISDFVWYVMGESGQFPNQVYFSPNEFKNVLHFMINRDMNVGLLVFYGAFQGDKMLGIVGFEPYCSRISYLYVLPEYQRKGIGSKLLDVIIRGIMDTPSVILRAHRDAVPMYEKYGFKKNGDDSPFSIGMEYVLRRK